jgi:hypothetical protein
MLFVWMLFGAAAGALGDWLAARLTGKTPTHMSVGIGALAGVALVLLVVTQPLHGWHGRLLPLWLWGWYIAADADLRAQELYDYHTLSLLGLALAAGMADRQTLVSVAVAAAIGGLWLIVRGGLRWWTWRTSAVLAAVGAIVLGIALRQVALAQDVLGVGGTLGTMQQAAVTLTSSFRTAVLCGFGVALAPMLAWMGAISQRASDPEAVVGGADVILWAAMGAWFGVRWVWPIAAVAVLALGLAAVVQRGARFAGWRVPWAADHLPLLPVMFIVVAIAA